MNRQQAMTFLSDKSPTGASALVADKVGSFQAGNYSLIVGRYEDPGGGQSSAGKDEDDLWVVLAIHCVAGVSLYRASLLPKSKITRIVRPDSVGQDGDAYLLSLIHI